MTQAGIEAAPFRFVAKHLNHCATAGKILPYFRYLLLNVVFQLSHETAHFRTYDYLNIVSLFWCEVDSSWNVMAHGDAPRGGGEGETGEWSG